MTKPTSEQITKLPKWAQDHIDSLEREVATWRGAALRFEKEQPESPFYLDGYCNQSKIRQFITAPMSTVSCDHAGVHMEIFLPLKEDGQRLFGPEIRFNEIGRFTGSYAAIVPRSVGTIQLVHKDNLR